MHTKRDSLKLMHTVSRPRQAFSTVVGVLAVALSACVVAMASVSSAVAASQVPQRPSEVPTSQPPSPPLSEAYESIAYLVETYGVSKDEALRRLELQRDADSLSAELLAQNPIQYAGMWLDQANGGLLRIGMTDLNLPVIALDRFSQRENVRVFKAEWSLRDLWASAERVRSRLDPEQGRAVESRLDPEQGRAVDVDEQRNVVVVSEDPAAASSKLDPPASRLQAAVRPEGSKVVIRRSTRPAHTVTKEGIPGARAQTVSAFAAPSWCPTPTFCGPQMHGGSRLNIRRDDRSRSWGGCSNGFNIRGRRNGYVYTLTAGHCVIGSRHMHADVSSHAGQTVGCEDTRWQYKSQFMDYAFMPYCNNDLAVHWLNRFPNRNWVGSWCKGFSRPGSHCSSRNFAMTGVHAYVNIRTGWLVCASGSGSPVNSTNSVDTGAGAGWEPGTRCGQVTSKRSSQIYANICSRKGDSGGPLYSQVDARAYGILKDGTDTSGPCRQGEYSNYTSLSAILWHVNTHRGGGATVDFALIT